MRTDPRRVEIRWILALGAICVLVGAAIAALPWFLLGVVGAPFVGPVPAAFLIVAVIVLVAAAGLLALWWGIRRILHEQTP